MEEKKTNSEITEAVMEYILTTFHGAYEIYDVTYKSVSRKMVLEVIIDSPDGIKVDDCATVSRAVSEYLDETDIIHSMYTLEVSSPGVERVLKRFVDYERHVGRLIQWTIAPPDKGGKKESFRARLQEFSEEKIVVSHNKTLRSFSLTQVEKARAILEFPQSGKQG